MKLYYSPGACSLSPHIALIEAGLAHDLVKVNTKTKHFDGGGDFLAVNAKGYVPVLELDDGTRLTEGPAIVQYIADRTPDSGLAPKPGSMERVRVQGVTQKALTQTLRDLERLGLVSREVYAEVPPRVEYTLTPLGHSLVKVLDDIKEWTERHAPDVLQAQQRFDRQEAAKIARARAR